MEKYARAVIVLVHGTWGRGLWPSARRSKQTRWFDPRSEFSRRLATGLGRESPALEVIPFCWSGANSLVQRHKAANDLAFLIEKKFGSLLSTKVIIVGHSHGGNVALMASHILRDRADVGMVAIDVVALATPFVRMFPAQQTGGLQPFLAVVFSFYLTLFFEPIARIQRYLSAFLGFYNALLISVIVVSTVILLACVPFIGWNESTLPTLHRRVSRKRDHLISHCPAMSIGQDIGLLVVRGFNDEANMALIVGSIGNWLSELIYSIGGVTLFHLSVWYSRFFWIVPVFLGLMCLLLLISILGFSDFSFMPTFLGALLDLVDRSWRVALAIWPVALAILNWFVVVSFSSMLAGGSFKCVYGRELFFWSFSVHVTSDSVPDGSGSVDVVTLPPQQVRASILPVWSIRHSIYQNTACVDAVVSWISKRR